MTVIERSQAQTRSSPEAESCYILNLSCPSRPGVVGTVAQFMATHRCYILKMNQFDDTGSGMFYMRLAFRPDPDQGACREALSARFAEWAGEFGMQWAIHDATRPRRMVILVSRLEHCLADLLHRHRIGELPVTVPAVVSNHRDLEGLVGSFGVPFVHLPVSDANRTSQEERILELVQETGAEVVALARYMQVLQPWICARLWGHMINIHHSFLPSFAGGDPYWQAYSRGVKVIGATAHFVTSELDAGPIIEQVVERVDHTYQPQDLVAAGRDLERIALARAVKYQVEHRVFLNGDRTVVFR